MAEALIPVSDVPQRCLHCPALNRVLLVGDAANGGADVARALQPMGLHAHIVATGAPLAQIDENDFELVLWNAHLPGDKEREALRQLLRQCPRLPILVLTDDALAETAIELAKVGVHDFLARPFEPVQLRAAIGRALQSRQRLCEASLLPGAPAGQAARFVGKSQAMQAVFKQIGMVAGRDEPVLILGETGTGKELVAQTIHRHSERAGRPFLAINCAALPENLLESELFGHEKGAFTGAHQRRLGAFELAHGGTLFLDEIGDMSLPLQSRMLRALQEGEIHRVGGQETIAVDVRVLTATHRVMEKAIQEGNFREDLYYRLNVVSIRLPPLREHSEDIQDLADHFIDRYTRPGELRPALDARALMKLQRHSWPGNVRELENTIRRALVTSRGQAIMEKDILVESAALLSVDLAHCQNCRAVSGQSSVELPQPPPVESRLNEAIKEWFAHQAGRVGDDESSLSERMEAKLLSAALEFTGGNKVRAARLLGISRSTLRQWLARQDEPLDKGPEL